MDLLLLDEGPCSSTTGRLDGRHDYLVTFNLRGTKIVIPATAADGHPNSTLWKTLRGTLKPAPLRDADGNVYFNRNPEMFHFVLDAVVNEDSPLSSTKRPPGLEDELHFWGIRSKRGRNDDSPASHPSVSTIDDERSKSVVRVGRSYGDLEVTYAKASPFTIPR